MTYRTRPRVARRAGAAPDGGRACGGRAPGRRGRVRASAVVAAALWLGGCGYGRIHELGEQVVAARDEIEVELQRRVELVPGLIEAAAEHGAASDSTVEAVGEARLQLARAVRSGDLSAMQAADSALCRALDGLMAEAAEHRGLNGDAVFELLRARLEVTELGTVRASRRYNEAVRRYNEYIGGFPQLLTARLMGAERLDPFAPPVAQSGFPSVDE